MRKALKKPANNAAWTTYQLRGTSNGGNTYEYEYGIHLLEPFSLAFAVDDLRSCRSHIRRYMVMRLGTCLHYSIPRQS